MNVVVNEYSFPSGHKLQLVHGDITDENVDAIVNAANTYLAHGAGVAGAIVRRGGRQIQIESDQWVQQYGLVSHGEPAYTHAGKLASKYVIHAVGPRWGEGDEPVKLVAAVTGSIRRAEELGLNSMAFPAISTGIYGFPLPLAAKIMLSAISGYMTDHPKSSLMLVRMVLFDLDSLQAFLSEWGQNDHLRA
jgi:O-acetyl-ADP-ribose deacetylase